MTRQLAQQLARRGQSVEEIQLDLFSTELRRGMRAAPVRSSMRKYRGWLKRYQMWCRARGYQTEVSFMSEPVVNEFIQMLITGDDPYKPSSARQAVSALRHYAERAAVDPMPTFRPALTMIELFESRLIARGLVPDRAQRRG